MSGNKPVERNGDRQYPKIINRERPKIYVRPTGARYVKAGELLRSQRAYDQIKALAELDFGQGTVASAGAPEKPVAT